MKRLFILLLAVMLMPLFVSAATITDLTLTGDAGTTVSGKVIVSGLTADDINLELRPTDLVFGSNLLSKNQVTITPGDSEFAISVVIPASQVSGTYFGTLSLYSGSTLLDESTLVVAAQNTVGQGASFTLSELNFGSSNQRREETSIGTFNLQNTGSESLTIGLTNTVNSKYQLTLSQTSITLASGESTTVTATIFVPDDQDSGRKTIGIISANAGSLSKSSNVYLTTKSELVITRVKANVDGKSSTLDDGEDVDAKLNDDVILTVTLKNEFDENIDIEDVDIDVNADNDLDWDDSTDFSRIKEGDKEEVDFSFTVPDDIDEDDYDVDFTAEGIDENGARHSADYTITINVDRETHEISILSVSLNPTRVSCGDRVTVRTRVQNTGVRDEDNVDIAVENTDLRIAEYIKRQSIDTDDIVDKSVSFDVPSNAIAGEYIIDVSTYYDSKQSDYGVVSLYVEKCGGSTTTTTNPPLGNGGTGTGTNTNTNTGNTASNPQQPPAIIVPTGSTGPVYGTTSFFNSPAYMILLVAAILIFIILILILLLKFVF